MKNKYDRIPLPFGNSYAIADPLIIKFLDDMDINIVSILQDEDIHKEFLKEYKSWIARTDNNIMRGLEKYPYACFSNGTTEAFEKFYGKHSKRRFRFYKGEFVYHRLNCRNNGYDWEYIEDAPLDDNDVVIISLPFSDTGNRHTSMDVILDQCDELSIPVLLDCAYFGICGNIDFDLDRKCVTDVTFSLSKSLYCAPARIGMRLTKVDDDDPLFVTNKMGYVNRVSAYIGLQLINNFSADYIYQNYRSRQELYCEILDVEPSNCVLFGIGDHRWNEYNRDRETNRLSLYKYLSDDYADHVRKIANKKRETSENENTG
jgi:hypothetical protein